MPPRTSKRKAVAGHSVLGKKSKRSLRAAGTESSEMPSGQPDDQGSSHGVWLDALPQDLCVRIAAYLTRDRNAIQPEFLNEDALALAETSSKLRSAMAEALDHTPDLRYGDVKLWLNVFQNPIYIDAREGRGNAVLRLLARSTLRAAQISNRGNHFTSIASGNSVAELSIHLERLTESRYTSMLEMLQKLSHLVSLSIICDPVQTCAFECIIDGQIAYNRLAEACPRLMALHMCCNCRTEVDHSPVVEAFPSLKELTVAKPLPCEALPYIRSRESVVLVSDRRPLCRYASEIGSAVTGIKFPGPKWSFSDSGRPPFWMKHASKEEVAMLKECPRLQDLDLLLCPGAEKEIPEWKLLLSLQLHWNIKVRGYEESSWLGTPLDGSWLRRICAQPLLQKFALVGAPVEMDDLVAVLRTFGKSLEELTTSLTGQPDSATDRLLGIMDAVTRYNDRLQILRVVEPQWMEWSELGKCVSRASIEERKKFLPRFFLRLRRLQRKSPWFDSTALLQTAHHVMDQCQAVMDN